jgi:Fic family protein
MNIETRQKGRKKLFYLAHSFRDGGKVRKVRRYLGAGLSEKEIEALRPAAERALAQQVESYRKISDPLHNALSPAEIESVKELVGKADLVIKHLSEEDWTAFTQRFAYDTNAIEGSTVTLGEAKDIIENDRWPKEKAKWEIAETYGVAGAIKRIRETSDHISLELIRDLHRMVFSNSKSFAGHLRGPGVEVAVTDGRGAIIHRGAPQSKVVGLLNELISWYGRNKSKYHPLVLAAVAHNQFETIHPFADGNGRVGRLLLNNILLRHGLPPVNIELKNRREYYDALHAYQAGGNIRPTIVLILKEYKKMKKIM